MTAIIGRTDVQELAMETSGNGDGPAAAIVAADQHESVVAGPRRRRVDRDELTVLVRERWREIAGWSGILLGGVAGYLTWIGVAGKDIAPLQLPYLASGGIAAVVLTIAGVGLLVGADLQRDRQRLRRIEGELVELQDLVRSLAQDDAPLRTSSTPPRRSRAAASKK